MLMMNQVGFLKGKQQRVIATTASPVHIHQQKDKARLKTLVPEGPVYDATSETSVYSVELALDPGQYTITQNKQAYEITVSANPFEAVTQALLRAFYYLRCGETLPKVTAGLYHHGPCHTAKAIVYDNPTEMVDVSGGWHDAGDYGKYVVAAGKAIADLLLTFDDFSDRYRNQSGTTGLPYLLEEVKVELDFLLKCQRADGAVYHKVTTEQFPPFDRHPEADTMRLVLSPVSDTATASFAATLADAARVFKPYLADYSDRLLEAAIKAFDRLEQGGLAPFVNPPSISTGEYGDPSCLDETYWASATLYRTTGDSRYLTVFKTLYAKLSDPLHLGWVDMSGYGSISYLKNPKADRNEPIYQDILTRLSATVDQRLEVIKASGFKLAMRREDFVWGSNMEVANQAIQFILAYQCFGDARYEQAALDHFDYLLGKNILGKSYVTGFGANSVLFPHYRPQMHLGVNEPVPGFVSGGPNKNLEDPYAQEQIKMAAPQACFVDHFESFATNEITIYWNAPVVYLASYFTEAFAEE